MGSSRLPGKALLPNGKKRMLEWAVKNAEASERADGVVVATGACSENQAITEWCERIDTEYMAGPEENLLKATCARG